MPRRPFIVRCASRRPSGMAMATATSAGPPSAAARLCSISAIIRRGAGLIAGSPTARLKPGRVTMPTPSPARNTIPASGGAGRTQDSTSAPWVTSGSSPASLRTPARPWPRASSATTRGKAGASPPGSVTETGSGKRPVTSAV